ncbi:MAG TPA: response regulator [Candidatus Hydrogenedentes bacterium]|nr:response regulator [Candidatus Hydrogenedentota bacterium]HOL75715.1 response regulator [Candidatus Hydrogenedentota bacterium]HPO84292.1 response regulator [Candidatus Hydrogenedentota bacterium]
MAINVLVVDDSETVRQVIAKTLQLANLPIGQVFMAGNGKEALDVLADNWVDLVFSDINMPVMGGIELIERMRSDELLKTIPVIVVSTEGSTTRIEELRAKGVSAYVRKPFTPETLRKVVEDVLGALKDEDGT